MAKDTLIYYRSPRSIHKGLPLRELFSPKSPSNVPRQYRNDDQVRLFLSPRPKVWRLFEGSFDCVESAMRWVPELERQGFRVKVIAA